MTDSFCLAGKRAIVTGASRGLGKRFALALARAGADLIIASWDKVDCEGVRRELFPLGREVASFSLDVRLKDSIDRFAQEVLAEYGRVEILVNNAGCNVRKPVLETTWDDWNVVLDTNLRGTFFMCKAFGQSMIENGYGKIINVGSVTSVFGYGGIVAYCASRGGVMQLTKALADEWGVHGINANVLAPGWFKTAQTQVLYENREWVEYLCDRIPLKRPGHPQDLDGAVVFLASDASEYITGQILLVDGGITTGATRATIEK